MNFRLRETQELPLAELDIPASALVCAPKSYRTEHYDTELRTTKELPAIPDVPGPGFTAESEGE